jgi:hypothetical protein
MESFAVTIFAYTLSVFLAGFGAILIWKIATNRIDLKYLIADEEGSASMSRFQFLLFTIIVAGCIAYLVFKGDKFPHVDQNILILIGISGGTYAVAKGIDKRAETVAEETKKGAG